MISAQGMDIGGAGVGHDPSADSGAAHLAVSRLTIGSWNLVSKHDEHILLSFYWGERKLVWEVLHAGVVRKMEVGFEDVVEAALSSSGPEDPERLVLELARPPRFFKEQMTVAGGAKQANYVYTTDFTSGQASQVSRHILYFAAGMASGQAEAMRAHGLPVRSEGASRGGDLMGSSALLGGSGGGAKATGHASSAALRQPPTSSPRLDAIILQEQLDPCLPPPPCLPRPLQIYDNDPYPHPYPHPHPNPHPHPSRSSSTARCVRGRRATRASAACARASSAPPSTSSSAPSRATRANAAKRAPRPQPP